MTIEQALVVLEYLDECYVEGDNVYWTEDKELAIRNTGRKTKGLIWNCLK